MTYINWLILYLIWHIPALLVGYAVVIQYERGGAWSALKVLALFVAALDIVMNFTTFTVLFWRVPKFKNPGGKREFTFSQSLYAIVREGGWRAKLGLVVVRVLNWFAPSGVHIRIDDIGPAV